jgi:ribonuclease HI
MLTLFADASFCPKTGAAGWGSWAIRDGWPKGKFHGGAFRRELRNANEAELCGLASALWMHNRGGDLAEVDTFMLQCDNMVALETIRQHCGGIFRKAKGIRLPPPNIRKTKLSAIEHEAVKAISEIANARSILLRHVKGHNGTDDGRSWVNTQCDTTAKLHMKARRRELELAA